MKKLKEKVKFFLQKHDNFGLYLVLILGISLIPLLIAGRYNVMVADDYAIGKECHHIWEETKSIPNMLRYAFLHAYELYRTWRGSFLINFFDSLNPGFFGSGLTWITPIMMLASMILSLYLFVKTTITYFFDENKKEILMVFGVITFLVIQTIPSPVEGFYWYAGAIAYTFFHYLMLLLFCIVLYIEKAGNKCKRIGLGIVACLYAFFVGGSQYITVLECLLWYAVYLLLNYKKLKWWKIMPGITLLCGALLNFFSPGNGVRQQETEGFSPVIAILKSFIEAFRYGKEWLSPIVVVAVFFLVPVVWKILRNKKGEYPYRYPLVVLILSYCIFSASFTPSLYGVGNVDSGRIQNLIQSIFYIILLIDLFYVTGWIQHKMDSMKEGFFADLCAVKNILKKYTWIYSWVMFTGILLVLVGTGDKNTFASVSAMRSLLNGEITIYYAEAQERLKIYEDDSIKVAEVKEFSAKPHVLYFTDIAPETDANYWINENIAEYYDKDKVVLIETVE